MGVHLSKAEGARDVLRLYHPRTSGGQIFRVVLSGLFPPTTRDSSATDFKLWPSRHYKYQPSESKSAWLSSPASFAPANVFWKRRGRGIAAGVRPRLPRGAREPRRLAAIPCVSGRTRGEPKGREKLRLLLVSGPGAAARGR